MPTELYVTALFRADGTEVDEDVYGYVDEEDLGLIIEACEYDLKTRPEGWFYEVNVTNRHTTYETVATVTL